MYKPTLAGVSKISATLEINQLTQHARFSPNCDEDIQGITLPPCVAAYKAFPHKIIQMKMAKLYEQMLKD